MSDEQRLELQVDIFGAGNQPAHILPNLTPDDLITAIGGFGDELAKVRDAAESGNAADLQTLALGLPQVAEAFQTELSRIQDAAIEAGVPIEDSGN